MMDAVNSVMQARQVALDTQIQMAVARKALDTQEAIGEAVVALLDAAASIGREMGLGERFDAVG
jgi:hypothetical protein